MAPAHIPRQHVFILPFLFLCGPCRAGNDAAPGQVLDADFAIDA